MKKTYCKICNEYFYRNNFWRHLKTKHDLTSPEYWLIYFDSKANICKNPTCNKKTKFIDLGKGFNEYCSLKCCYVKNSSRNNLIGAQRKGKTFQNMYGEKSKAIKLKLSNKNKGQKRPKEFSEMLSKIKTGVPRINSEKTKKLYQTEEYKHRFRGKNNGNWKGGTTSLAYLILESTDNENWKNYIRDRDQGCVICGGLSGNKTLHVHHLDSLSYLINKYSLTKNNWWKFKNILFEKSNGVLLCNFHHNANNGISFHSMFGRNQTTSKQFWFYFKWYLINYTKEVSIFFKKQPLETLLHLPIPH